MARRYRHRGDDEAHLPRGAARRQRARGRARRAVRPVDGDGAAEGRYARWAPRGIADLGDPVGLRGVAADPHQGRRRGAAAARRRDRGRHGEGDLDRLHRGDREPGRRRGGDFAQQPARARARQRDELQGRLVRRRGPAFARAARGRALARRCLARRPARVTRSPRRRRHRDGRHRRVVAHLHDDAWLDGPLGLRDPRGDDVTGTAGWLADGETVYYGSEESGWAHVYTVPARGGSPRALTSGEWEVQSVDLSSDRRTLYLRTNEGDFGQVHFYALDPATRTKTQLTTAEGRQDVVASSDRSLLAVLHSTANHPPELYLQPGRAGAAMRQVTESTTPQWRSFAWNKPEIVMVPARDGVRVPARLYRPSGAANRAAVIFVHGAGYLQNVHKWWSFYYREYMFHHLLASKGYTVLDLDYRGSAGHGRAWRTAIYRHMGGADLDDQVDGARWLVRQLGIDSTRVGIYGGSYGGFITLMAMFTRPGVFAAGAALRPVTDWAHYNHPYTARILNEPQMDSVAYRQSSPIYFAAGLKGRILICHGMVDDKVQFQDNVRLVQRLIELGKEGWEVAVYPVEPHGFRRADSWTDEDRRLLKLFEETVGKP